VKWLAYETLEHETETFSQLLETETISCNSLPDDIITAQSLPAFRRKLKAHLFLQSYWDILLQFQTVFAMVVLAVAFYFRPP